MSDPAIAVSTSRMLSLHSRRVALGLQQRSFSMASVADIDLSIASAQTESVLFTLLPVEIRTRIFEYALTPDANPMKAYLPDRVYYRPGHHFHPKTDISLLLTCKQIFAEARLMPVAEAEHTFWLFGGPYQMMKTQINGMARFDSWMASLNEDQQQSVRHVHLFAQQYHFENMGQKSRMPTLSTLSAKHLTITFRHSDWWSWESPAESSDKLGICPWLPGRVSHQAMLAEPLEPTLESIKEGLKSGTWGQQVSQINGLHTLRIEFEIDVSKKPQLDVVMARARHWKFPLADSNDILVHDGYVREWEWKGLANLKHDNAPVLRSPPLDDPTWDDRPKRNYYVAEMRWKRVRVHE